MAPTTDADGSAPQHAREVPELQRALHHGFHRRDLADAERLTHAFMAQRPAWKDHPRVREASSEGAR